LTSAGGKTRLISVKQLYSTSLQIHKKKIWLKTDYFYQCKNHFQNTMVFVKTARQKKIQRVKKFNKTVNNRGAFINTICHALFRKKK